MSDGADVVFANLEMPFTREKKAHRVGARSSFAGEPRNASLLQKTGINCLNIGTNHSMDWGPEGIETTKELLKNLGIVHVGAGENLSDAARAGIFKADERQIGLLGFCKPGEFSAGSKKPGAAVYKDKAVRRAVEQLRPLVDFLILSLHVGFEYCQYPTPKLVSNCRRYVDLGADLVVCHHAHVLQAVEVYRKGVIAYNLGNFMFDSRAGHVHTDTMWRERHWSAILEATFPPGGKPSFRLIPALIDDRGIPGEPDSETGREIIELVDRLTSKLDTMSTSEVYSHAVGNVLDREVATYKKLWKENGWRFAWQAIRNFRPRHVRMMLAYFWRKLIRKGRGK